MNQVDQIKELQRRGYGAKEIATRLNIDRKTTTKYMRREDFNAEVIPPRTLPSRLDPWNPQIDQWLEEDRRTRFKHRHTNIVVEKLHAHRRIKTLGLWKSASRQARSLIPRTVSLLGGRFLSLKRCNGGAPSGSRGAWLHAGAGRGLHDFENVLSGTMERLQDHTAAVTPPAHHSRRRRVSSS